MTTLEFTDSQGVRFQFDIYHDSDSIYFRSSTYLTTRPFFHIVGGKIIHKNWASDLFQNAVKTLSQSQEAESFIVRVMKHRALL